MMCCISFHDRHSLIASFLFHWFRAFGFKMNENVQCPRVQGKSWTCNRQEGIQGLIIHNKHKVCHVAGYFWIHRRKALNKTSKQYKNFLSYSEQAECVISYLLNPRVSEEFVLVHGVAQHRPVKTAVSELITST